MTKAIAMFGLWLAIAASCAGCHTTTATGSFGKKLTLMRPANQSLARGDTNKVAVLVSRENIPADVPVRFENLPSGVRVIEKDRKVKEGELVVNYTLYAANDAPLVKGQKVNVTASDPSGLAATESFEVSVTE